MGGKKTTQRGCFERPIVYYPWFSGAEISASLWGETRTSGPAVHSLLDPRKPPPHTLSHTHSPTLLLLSHLSQPGNQWEMHTQTQHGCESVQDELLWHVGLANKSVSRHDNRVLGCTFYDPLLVLTPQLLNTDRRSNMSKQKYKAEEVLWFLQVPPISLGQEHFRLWHVDLFSHVIAFTYDTQKSSTHSAKKYAVQIYNTFFVFYNMLAFFELRTMSLLFFFNFLF